MGLLILFSIAAAIILLAGTWVLARSMTRPPRRTFASAVARNLPTGPTELGMEGRDTILHFEDGTAAPAWIVHGRNPHGPIVIITHGWANSRFGALPKASLYGDYASSIVVYDVRGHGESTARITTLGTREAHDLIAITDQVRDDPHTPIVLVGSSMGAVITLMAVSLLSQREADDRVPLAGVVIDGPYCSQMEPVIAHLRIEGLPAQPFAWLAHGWLKLRFPGYGRFDGVAAAAKVTCPLLVLHGSEDPICSVASGQAIAHAAPQGELVEFSGAGHGGLLAHDERRYTEALHRFMQRLTSSRHAD